MQLNKNQLLFFGLAAHLLAAFFSIGAHQCDEIFQVYEFAGYKLGLNLASDLPWEFHEQMRSGLQPYMVYSITKVLNAISIENPFSISLIIRTLQALFSFFVIFQFLKVTEREIHSQKHKLWLYGFGLLFCYLPYFHARFSSENFSATLFIFGLVILLNAIQNDSSLLKFLFAGILFGLAFESRFQMSFMILGLFLWLIFIRKIGFKFLAFAFLGIIFSICIGLLADHWLYDQWTFSWWNYLDLNLFKDKASVYGREPVYFYLGESLLQLIPPFSVVILFCVFGFWSKFKTHVITWITVPFIILHFFVAHKELRFLFPMLNFLPFMVIFYLQASENTGNKLVDLITNKRFVKFAVIVNGLILLFFTFKPADNTAPVLKAIYSLANQENAVLLYEDRNPYNNLASLNYFRNKHIQTVDVKNDSLTIQNNKLYFFSEKFNDAELLVKNNIVFVKQYSNFPQWFKYLNFNGWLDRAETFSIYRSVKPI